MLAIMAVPMLVMIIFIIPFEAVFASRFFMVPRSKGWRISLVANAVSTIVVVPLTWALLTGLEFQINQGLYRLYPSFLTDYLHFQPGAYNVLAGTKLFFLAMTFPWLYPTIVSDLYWMLPTAALLLLIPFFFASLWTQYAVASGFLRFEDRKQVMTWAWKSNYASYLVMAFATCICLGLSILHHELTAVDRVSASSLWQLAIERTRRLQKDHRSHSQESPSQSCREQILHNQKTAKTEMDRYYWEAQYQLEIGNPKEAEKILLCAVAKIDSKDYQKSNSFKIKYGDGLNIFDLLAGLYYRQGRFASACEVYERLVVLEDQRLDNAEPGDYMSPWYPRNLGAAYEKLDKPEKVDSYYQHIFSRSDKLNKTDGFFLVPDFIAYGNFCKKRHKLKEAEKLYIRAINIPDSYSWDGGEPYRVLAEFYMEQKQFTQAEQTLLAAMRAKRQNNMAGYFSDDIALLCLDLGKCYLQTGNLDQAEHFLKLSLQGDSTIADVAETYAVIQEKRRDAQQARLWRERSNQARQIQQYIKS
jgi:tetratricopeptide (TPR) repeat protein